MKIGSIDILKAYLGMRELSHINAYLGDKHLIDSAPEPALNYFYLETADANAPITMTPSDCFAYTGEGSAAENLQYSTNGSSWTGFENLAHYGESTITFTNKPLQDLFGEYNNIFVVLISKTNYNTVVNAGYNFYCTKAGSDTNIRQLTILGEDDNNYYIACNVNVNLWDGNRNQVTVGFGVDGETLLVIKLTYIYATTGSMPEYRFARISSVTVGETYAMSLVTTYADMYTIISGQWTITGYYYDNIVANKIYIRGLNNAIVGTSRRTESPFTITGNFNVGGDIRTLVDYTNPNETIIQSDYEFYKLFCNKTNLLSTYNLLLNYETLVISCYDSMFQGCTSLTTAPALPATTLVNRCYGSMFYGCTSLVNAPELHSTTLASSCYYMMFFNCTSLTTAPELPATTLENGCYNYMFFGCTSLTTAPELPATSLTLNCYSSMFSGCTSLVNAPALPATTLVGWCYSGMFYDCTSLTAAPVLPATTLAYCCYQYMFFKCTSLTTAPELPATTLVDYCYKEMFNGCPNINYIKCLATDISVSSALSSWVSGVASTGTFVKSSAASWPTGPNGIPTGWTVVEV